ncbi:MAG: hypothetical protein R8M11_03660 [Gallionella sp.]
MYRILLALWLSLAVMPVSWADTGGTFAQGHSQFSLVAGTTYAFEKSYIVIGGSASYNVMDGLGVGLSLEKWSGDGPGITKYSPLVQYVFYQVPGFQPYVGTFYRRTIIEGLPSINSTGYRAGVMVASGANAYLSIGFVNETYLDCQESIYRVCSETSPDISVIIGF